MSEILIPIVTGGSLAAFWLDLTCPSCGARNRIGTSCPLDGKPCSCGHLIDFWAAWRREDAREEHNSLLREYWADQFEPEDFRV